MVNLKSYLDKSLFFEEIWKPFEINIDLKENTDNNLTTESKCIKQISGIKNFNYMEEIDFFNGAKMKDFVGSCSTYEEKNDSDNMIFTMVDNIVFHSKVSIKTDDEIEIITKIDIVRNVDGINYDGKSIRDNTIFKDFPHENYTGSIEMKEYYKVIANGTRLLHYSDDSNFFEVYNLTDGWNVKDGIEKLGSPKIYEKSDDKNIQDKDLEEIMSIINSNQTNQAKQLIKKNDSTK